MEWRRVRGDVCPDININAQTCASTLPSNATTFKDFNDPVFISPLFRALALLGHRDHWMQKALRIRSRGQLRVLRGRLKN